MKNGRILIVDDEPDLCTLLEAQLRRRGFDAHSTTDPLQAPELVERAGIDVVVADITMPEVSGLELCVRLAEKAPDVPVVVITAFGNLETAIEAIRAGAHDLVTKPLDLDALTDALSRALRRRSLRGSAAQDGDPATLAPMAEIQRLHILGVLRAVGGNKSQAAKTLGVDRKTLYRKLVQYAGEEKRVQGGA